MEPLKISIIGAGRLGGLIGFLAAEGGLADEISLIDLNKAGAEGRALDISHSFFKSGKIPKICAFDYSSISDAVSGSKIVVITAGKPRTATMNSRTELLSENAKIIKAISAQIKPYCKGAVLITTTNPVDAINFVLWKETGFERSKIIGFGGLLDSARLGVIMAEELNAPASPTECAVIGEHGENMVPLFSRAIIGGGNAAFSAEQKERIKSRLLSCSKSVIEKKGATEYGPVSHIMRIAKAVLQDEKQTLLCSCVLKGEYGISGVSLGVPAVIGKSGIEKIEEWKLNSEEASALKKAEDKVRQDVETARTWKQ